MQILTVGNRILNTDKCISIYVIPRRSQIGSYAIEAEIELGTGRMVILYGTEQRCQNCLAIIWQAMENGDKALDLNKYFVD